MTNAPDDLEAVRSITKALEPFDNDTRVRVVRWAMEKLGLKLDNTPLYEAFSKKDAVQISQLIHKRTPADIRAFVIQKNPASDTHFAATVAYFYRFEALESEQKESISTEELKEACRQVDRKRIKYPSQTLNNAYKEGLLDKAGEKGRYKINTVGENLVALALPGASVKKNAPKIPKKKKPNKQKAKYK